MARYPPRDTSGVTGTDLFNIGSHSMKIRIQALLLIGLVFVLPEAYSEVELQPQETIQAWTFLPASERKSVGPARGCFLRSNTITMSDGYRDIEVFIEMDDDALVMVTPSTIDNSFHDLGLIVDHYEFLPMDKIIKKDQYALFEKRIELIIPWFIRGLKATFSLRFWPTWPAKAKPQLAEFSLIGFTHAYENYQRCQYVEGGVSFRSQN